MFFYTFFNKKKLLWNPHLWPLKIPLVTLRTITNSLTPKFRSKKTCGKGKSLCKTLILREGKGGYFELEPSANKFEHFEAKN